MERKNKSRKSEDNKSTSYFSYIVWVPLLVAVSAALHRIDVRPFFLFSVLVFSLFVLAIPIFNRNFLALGIIFAVLIIFGGIALDVLIVPNDLFKKLSTKRAPQVPQAQEQQQEKQVLQEQQQQQQETEEIEEQETEEEAEALEFSDLPGVTFVPETLHSKMGLSTEKLTPDFDVEKANINLLDRWIDVNETLHLVVAQLKEQTVTGDDARVYNFPAFFMKNDENRGLLIIGPNNRRFEKFVSVADGKFKIHKYDSKMEAQSIAESYHYLRDAMNAAEREIAEGQQQQQQQS